MKRFLPVRAVALHQRNIIFRGRRIPAASVFPFFDDDGDIYHLLIVDPVSSELYVCQPWDVGRLPLFGTVLIYRGTPITHCGVMDELAELLHFDPWWVLLQDPFPMLDEVSILRRTNCVDDFHGMVNGLYFSGDLTKVQQTYRQMDGEYTAKKFSRDLLSGRVRPTSIPADDVKDTSKGWKLAPFWMTR